MNPECALHAWGVARVNKEKLHRKTVKCSGENKNYNRLQPTTEYSYDGRKVYDSTTNYNSTCLVKRKKVVGNSDKNQLFSATNYNQNIPYE